MMKKSKPGAPEVGAWEIASFNADANKAEKGFVIPVNRDAEYEANLDYLAEILADKYLKQHGGNKQKGDYLL